MRPSWVMGIMYSGIEIIYSGVDIYIISDIFEELGPPISELTLWFSLLDWGVTRWLEVIGMVEMVVENMDSKGVEKGVEIDVVCATLKLIIKTLKKNTVREIIRVLIIAQEPLTAEEIIEKTGLPRATVYVNLKELERIGFVKVVEDKKPRKYTITKFMKKLLELPEDQEKEGLLNIKKLVAKVT